jgi:hypothetical protein
LRNARPKNQVTLPKAIVQAVGDFDYYDVSTENGRIVLTPVRIQWGRLGNSFIVARHFERRRVNRFRFHI